MNVFVDTNVLLAATDRARPDHLTALGYLQSGQDSLFASPQVLREYLVVATRPGAANGLGLSMADALANIQAFGQIIALVWESEAVWNELQRIMAGGDPPLGKRIHDANIAATALANGIDHLATFNTADFAGLPIAAFEPTPAGP